MIRNILSTTGEFVSCFAFSIVFVHLAHLTIDDARAWLKRKLTPGTDQEIEKDGPEVARLASIAADRIEMYMREPGMTRHDAMSLAEEWLLDQQYDTIMIELAMAEAEASVLWF